MFATGGKCFIAQTMEDKIDNLTKLMNNVVTNLSSVNSKLDAHDRILKSGQVDGSLGASYHQNATDDDAAGATSVYDRVNETFRLGASSVFSPQSGPTGYATHEESTPSTSSNDELQQQYKSVKDSVQKIRLPPGLKIETSLRGVGQQFNKTARVIHAASDYSETLLKLLLSIDTNSDPIVVTDDLIDCLVVAVTAQIRYLQSEKSVCFISGRFGEDVGSLFREFKTHASSLSASDIQVLENVIQLSAARQPRGRGFPSQRRPYGNNPNYRSRGFQPRRGGHTPHFSARSYQPETDSSQHNT